MKSFIVVFLCISTALLGQQKKYLDSILDLENKISNEKYLDTILQISYNDALTNTKKFLLLAKKATKIAQQLKDKSKIAKSYRAQSLAYHFSSNFDEAINYIIKAAKIYDDILDRENAANAYLDLGWRLKGFNLQKAIQYMHKGLQILKKYDNKPFNLIGAFNNYGTLKKYNNELDSAFYYHKKSLKLAKLKKDEVGIPYAQTNIAMLFLKQKKYNLAKSYLDSAMQIRLERKDIYGITDSYLYYGDFFFEKQDYNNAIRNFKKALQLSKQNGYFPLKKYALELLHKSNDSLKNYQKSLFYFKKFSSLKDSINNVNTNTKIAELEIEYETTKKEIKIAEQEIEIKKRNLFAILLIAALVILGIIFFSIYKRNQLKRNQLQKEIELKDALALIKTKNRLQEERLKISRDLHDNIGSQLTFIISSIDNLKFVTKDTNKKLKEKLSDISSFTSDTIRQLRDTIWAMNKSEIYVEDLHARVLSFIEKAKLATQNISFSINYNIDKNLSFSSIKGMHIFRVIQEAINNAIKYADANKIEIYLSKKNTMFIASIKDDGKGFNLKTTTLGNGLSNMEKRMNEINGRVLIKSVILKGTTIQLEVPLKNTTNDV